MRWIGISCLVMLLSCGGSRQLTGLKDSNVQTNLSTTLTESVSQYKQLARLAPPDRLPRTYEKGQLLTTGTGGWVSGFYPGTLLNLYRFSKDTALLNEATKRLRLLEKEQYNKNTHDLGFMMYCSFGNYNQAVGNHTYDQVLINSARSLCTRFNPVVGSIRSWNSDSAHFLVIIDNMMNLELLMYAFRQTGDSLFYNVAVTHANTTIKNHFRPDNSSYHVVDYNPVTGAVQVKRTHQGFADESAWARGQVWGLYGFTMLYRETGIHTYLQQALRIAGFLLNHPNLPADKVPYWDFNAPDIPNTYRDASAGAIMASALLELAGYASAAERKQFVETATTILSSLSKPPYKTSSNEAGGFILQHSVGHLPNKSEIDVPLSYADYYFVEAAMRYNGTLKTPTVISANTQR
jgi:hypothetical protein